MTDDIDRANERAEEHLGDALAAQARRARKYLGNESALECIDCDDLIPEARRQAIHGVQRCVCCAGALEKQVRFQ